MKRFSIYGQNSLSNNDTIEEKFIPLIEAIKSAPIGVCLKRLGSTLYENDRFIHMIQNDKGLRRFLEECEKKLFFQDRYTFSFHTAVKEYRVEAKVIRQNDERYIVFYVEETTLWTKKIEFLERIVEHLKVKCNLFKKEATYDALTQTYNKAQFEKILKQECERAKRYGEPLSLILIDLDDFKQINDRYGHLVGDFVLRKSIDHIKKIIRKSDFLVRIGGDEFAIIAPHTKSSEGIHIAKKIQDRLTRVIYQEIGFESIRCSFGITMCAKEDNIISLFQRADQALYRSKREGKNKITSI